MCIWVFAVLLKYKSKEVIDVPDDKAHSSSSFHADWEINSIRHYLTSKIVIRASILDYLSRLQLRSPQSCKMVFLCPIPWALSPWTSAQFLVYLYVCSCKNKEIMYGYDSPPLKLESNSKIY